jgi:NAD+ diphosphatase
MRSLQLLTLMAKPAYALFFHQDALVCNENTLQCVLPLECIPCQFHSDTHFYLGLYQDTPLYAVAIDGQLLLNQTALKLVPARQILIGTIDLALCNLICRAKQLLYWHRRSLFCGQCGEHTQFNTTENCKRCEPCQTSYYPYTAPAVIVVIRREQEILLARSPHFAPHMYSALAGFVEAGESCEQTLQREVLEEVGLRIQNMRYFGSQSWPFPNSFMVGFIADYASGEININPDEIEDAQWFNHHNLPPLPPPYSIARRLIEHVVNSIA